MTKDEDVQKLKDIELRINNLKTMQQKYNSLNMKEAAMRTHDRINEILEEREKLSKKLKTFNYGVESWLD